MNWLTKLLHAVSVDTVLAIDPNFSAKADATAAKANDSKAKAGTLRARATTMLQTAAGLDSEANRQLNAVENFRKASGG